MKIWIPTQRRSRRDGLRPQIHDRPWSFGYPFTRCQLASLLTSSYQLVGTHAQRYQQIQSRRPKKAQGTPRALLKISQWQDAPQVKDGKLIERKNDEKTQQKHRFTQCFDIRLRRIYTKTNVSTHHRLSIIKSPKKSVTSF